MRHADIFRRADLQVHDGDLAYRVACSKLGDASLTRIADPDKTIFRLAAE
jgi:hypothetical protein